MIVDAILLLMYIIICAWCAYRGPRSRRGLSILVVTGAVSIFVTADLMMRLPIAPNWFHLIIAMMCAIWSYVIISQCCNVYTALPINAMVLYQVILSVDGFLFPNSITLVSAQGAAVNIGLHLLILIATFTDGFNIHTRVKRGDSRYRSPI